MILTVFAALCFAATPEVPSNSVESTEDSTVETVDSEEVAHSPKDGVPMVIADEEGEVLMIYGDALVEQARREIIQDLKSQGYDQVKRKKNYVRLRSEESHQGEIRIYDDGWVHMKRQPLRFDSRELPWGKKGSPLSWATCALWPPMCVRAGGPLLAKRKWMAVKERTMDSIAEKIQVYGDRVADAKTDTVIRDLPEKLESLWLNGTPLNPDERPAVSPAERKQALLEFWDSRTETDWGNRVRSDVETFIRAVVQTSDDPLTAEEVQKFNEQRHSTIEFSLSPKERVSPIDAIVPADESTTAPMSEPISPVEPAPVEKIPDGIDAAPVAPSQVPISSGFPPIDVPVTPIDP